MGLAERRAAMDFETNHFPALKKLIDEAAGFAVPIEVRWETLSKDGKYVKSWNASWPKIYFIPIVEAFKQVCMDDMGREALKATLKKIVVQDTKTSHSSDWAELSDGTLTLDYMFTNANDVKSRTDVLLKKLLAAL